ncbi:uncharacterized protein LOC118504820 isoform X1 [Anopheles stephensi]|uniref:uncharacterized protein LOC118504820 isoform X1 n=1 Tax=Anopheles stephensi TaxID=30069 RepID=UPI001658B84B|nr:uncharacterized protein LOC118504820 isoform X1 [Anopheles stephensi]
MKGLNEGKGKVRYTKCQQEKLVEIMERNPEVARGATSNPTSFWKDVALELNSMGPAVKDGAAWKRSWIEKKSTVKKKLSQNKKEVQMTGGGNPRFTTLNELEERIAVITNIRDITARIEGSLCIGIRTEKRNEIDQPGQSHHSQATDQQDSSHQNQPTEQPGPSHHSQGNRNQSEPSEQKKTAAKTATSKLAEFQTKVLQQNEETNKHLREISDSFKMLTKGTLGIYEEMLNYMKHNK